MIRASSRDRPAASNARGSAQCASTARSVLVNSPVSGVTGISWRTRSLIRRWCSAPCWVNRSHARTRRSSAAASTPGSSNGCRLPGANSGSRARVSASMPLLLACRDKNRRRSAAFAEATRNTRWPRLVKNTATGSHAGPVGSITTSSRVPTGAPTNAAVSSRVRLSTVGQARRRHTSLPSPRSTRTVWSLAMPRSTPTSRRSARADRRSFSLITCSSLRCDRTLTSDRPQERRDDRRSRSHAAESADRRLPVTAPTHVL